jgi:Pyruvate/2-oxoacid:ferredoxin oxidoreductase gamma subunit
VPAGGLILYNGSAAPADLGAVSARMICVPASTIADRIGSAKVANMVLLGALLAEVDCLAASTALAVIQAKTGKSALLEANRKALEEGRKLIEEQSPVPALG